MNSRALVTWTIVLAIAAFLSLVVSFLQYVSERKPSLYAKLYGYPHYHLFSLGDASLDERDIISNNTIFPENAAVVRWVSGVYRVLISNEGAAVAREVNVHVPGGIGTQTLRSDRKENTDGGSVSLGDIKPGEEVELIAWTTRPIKLRQSGEPDISITYANGVVEIEQMYLIDGALRFIHKYDLHLYFVGLLLVVLVVALMAVANLEQESKSKETAESTDNSENKR